MPILNIKRIRSNSTQMKKPSINIVNYEEGIVKDGILTKHAREMERALLDKGYKVTVKNQPDPKADINHHINYIAAQDCPTLNTTMVTHFTSDMYQEKDKLDRMRKFLITGTGICFSEGVRRYLIKQGMPPEKLKVVLPAHDGQPRRPRVIAIAYKVYPDGRKREYMFDKLVRSLRKDNKKFVFRIMGPGWKDVLDKLPKDGPGVYWMDHFENELYKELLDTSDYLLYTGGEDAIAQCIVDAKNAGLRIIAPKQEDVEVDIPFKTQEELNEIFRKIAVNPVEGWTWDNYTQQHIDIWNEIYSKSKRSLKKEAKK